MGPARGMLMRVSQVPDWARRGIRLALALVTLCTLGVTLWMVPEPYREEWGDEVVQSCNWAGATCAVVAASPLIGRVAQLSYERTLGTLTGGLLGFLVYDYGVLMLPDGAAQALMVACAGLVGFASCWLSMRFKLDASMRLFVITFLIVTFGAHKADSQSALGVALLRTGGIICGVLLFMVLTVLILPKSATIESLRELKSGLKLLTELNSLVWRSRPEAQEAMKAAAQKAREAEAAAASVAAAKDADAALAAMPAAGGQASMSAGALWLLARFAGRVASRSQSRANGYQHLPDADPEMGRAAFGAPAALGPQAQARPAAGQGAAAAAGAGAVPAGPPDGLPAARPRPGGPVSQLTQALQHSSGGGAGAGGPAAAGPPQCLPSADPKLLDLSFTRGLPRQGAGCSAAAVAPTRPVQQQQQQQQAEEENETYRKVIDQYESRCESVLTQVYQSMFKVRDLMGTAESELYVHHAFGHYFFLPIFLPRGLMARLAPGRWRLPAAEIEEMAKSIRVIARLLWTVHLDYSQGFDKVLGALPPDMANLLQELGELVSAALGVLVEAFPNKTSILVDSLSQLSKLVARILSISEEQHASLIEELAANRLSANPTRPNRSGPLSAAAAAAACEAVPFSPGTPRAAPASLFAPPTLGGGRLEAAAAAAAGGPAAAPGAAAAAALPRGVAFVTFCDSDDGDEEGEAEGGLASGGGSYLLGSAALDGPGAPIPTESPQIRSPDGPQGSGPSPPAQGGEGPGAELPAELMFDLSDIAAAPPAAGGFVAGSAPWLQRAPSRVERLGAGAAGTPGTSLLRSMPRPHAVLAAVRLQHAAAAATTAAAATAAAGLGNPPSTVQLPPGSIGAAPAPKLQAASGAAGVVHPVTAFSAEAAAAGDGQQQQDQEQQQGMNFVQLTRWYSFCFLVSELRYEVDELYVSVREVLAALPHGV